MCGFASVHRLPRMLTRHGPSGARRCRRWFASATGVDWWTYVNVFLRQREPGVYVDLAAHTYFHPSDSYFFDRCLGWAGVCVEAAGAANLRACVNTPLPPASWCLLPQPRWVLEALRAVGGARRSQPP